MKKAFIPLIMILLSSLSCFSQDTTRVRIPIEHARFIKDELLRKQIADRQVAELKNKVSLLERDMSDATAFIDATWIQLESYQELLAIAERERKLDAVRAEAKLKLARKSAAKKTIGLTLGAGVVGFILGVFAL